MIAATITFDLTVFAAGMNFSSKPHDQIISDQIQLTTLFLMHSSVFSPRLLQAGAFSVSVNWKGFSCPT